MEAIFMPTLPELHVFMRAHANTVHPQEACGLIVQVDDKLAYLKCRNVADAPNDYFRIHPEDYAYAEDLGELRYVVHSHPNASANPSEADRVMCTASGVPWLILGGDTFEAIVTVEPGYSAPLKGRQFVHGIVDCYTLVRDYYAQVLNINLPNFKRADDWWVEGANRQNLYLDHFAEAGFVVVNELPREHDGILMTIRSQVPNHAAVMLGNGNVLHHLHGHLSCEEPYGYFYRHRTSLVVRHQSLLGSVYA
jgi:proteasome lid subunit RPN8/RPN11